MTLSLSLLQQHRMAAYSKSQGLSFPNLNYVRETVLFLRDNAFSSLKTLYLPLNLLEGKNSGSSDPRCRR